TGKPHLAAHPGAPRPPLYATLMIALAVVPLYAVERDGGGFFPDLATAFLAALAASMAVALVVIPALAALLFSRWGPDDTEPRPARWLQKTYEDGLSRIVQRAPVGDVAAGALIAATLVAV